MQAETARDLRAERVLTASGAPLPAGTDFRVHAITDAKVHGHKIPAYDRATRILLGDPGPRRRERSARMRYLGGNRIEECGWLPSSE